MAKTRVDYAVKTTTHAPAILVHSKSNYIGDICDAMIATGIDPATALSIDAIRSY